MNIIEISGSSIRMVRERDGRLLGLDSWRIPSGADPLTALASSPLPRPLGRVAVQLHHDEMLVRSLLQPAAAPERLERLVRFELSSMVGEGADAMSMSWHTVKLNLGDELRVLVLLAKQALIQRLRDALAPHGGRLAVLIPPSLGLWHCWKAQHGDHQEPAVLADIGGSRVHIALVDQGELLFLRTQTPGMDELVKAVAASRNLPEPEAEKLVARLGKGAPSDLHDLIAKQAGAIAQGIIASVRFAKTQLKLDKYDPTACYISGAGGQSVGFAEALKDRLGMPVRLINPFSGVLSGLPQDELDRASALPSAWTPAIGSALAKEIELDAMADERARRLQYWRTDGVLRLTAAAVLLLIVATLVRQELAIHSAAATAAILQGDPQKHDGLVPMAQTGEKVIHGLQDARARSAAQLAWLDAQHRVPRVAIELFAAIAQTQNPDKCPVTLTAYQVKHEGDATVAVIDGFAKSAGHDGTDVVLRNFEAGLKKAYAPISAMIPQPRAISQDNQPFEYRIEVKDATGKD